MCCALQACFSLKASGQPQLGSLASSIIRIDQCTAFLFSPSHSQKGIWEEDVLRGCTISDLSDNIYFSLPFQDELSYYLLDEVFLMTSLKFPHTPVSPHPYGCITHLELMISCWMWLVISELWLFPSQLPYKPCHGENLLFSPLASAMGPSSVP